MKMTKLIACLLTAILTLCLLCSCNQPGPQGPQGIQGEMGPQGIQGEPGPAGKDGASFLTGNGKPAEDLGKIGDSYIDLDIAEAWGFYLKGEDGWKLLGYLEVEPAPLDINDLNGSYALSYVVTDYRTYQIGDPFAGGTLSPDMIRAELQDGVGSLTVNFGSSVSTNITCTIEYNKLIMICQDSINITGEPHSVYELSIVRDGEIYVVLEAYGQYYYVKKIA